MYRLVIADDEAPIREGLRSLDWARMGYTVAGVVSNGAKVLALVEEGGIDAVLLDIHMPVMGGLNLAEELHRRFPGVHIVLLTGYSYFEYARKAIRYDVFRYLLKPVDVKELEDTFVQLAATMDTQRAARGRTQHLQTQNRQLLQRGVQQAAGLILAGEMTDPEEIETSFAAEIDIGGKAVLCALCRDVPRDWHETCTGEAEGGALDIIGLTVHEQTVLVLVQPPQSTLAAQWLEDRLPPGGRAVLSHEKEHPIYLRAQYLQVVAAAGEAAGWDGVVQAEETTARPPQLEYPYLLERQLSDAVLFGEEAGAGRLAAEYIAALRSRYEATQPTFLPGAVAVFVAVLHTKLRDLGGSSATLQQTGEDLRQLPVLPPDYENTFSLLMAHVCRKTHEAAGPGSGAAFPAREVKDYIKAHCTGKLTLEQTAGAFGFAPSYMSTCFKKWTGQNFIEYLKACRIEKAKQLLLETNLKIYQIGAEVGYENQKYFGELFKESVGCTPQKYRSYHP